MEARGDGMVVEEERRVASRKSPFSTADLTARATQAELRSLIAVVQESRETRIWRERLDTAT